MGVSGAKSPALVSCLLRAEGGGVGGTEGHKRPQGIGASGRVKVGRLVGAGVSEVALKPTGKAERGARGVVNVEAGWGVCGGQDGGGG